MRLAKWHGRGNLGGAGSARTGRARTRGRAEVPSGGATAVRCAAAAVCLSLLAGPARAQVDSAVARGTPAVIGWGKWVAVGLAAGFTTLGIEQHNSGNAAFRSLIAYCGQVAICTLAPDGRYADPTAEATYQRVVRGDRAARAWLVAGQLTAVGTAVLFVMDLMRQREPPNIPYSGLLVESRDGVTRIGVRIPVRILTGR